MWKRRGFLAGVFFAVMGVGAMGLAEEPVVDVSSPDGRIGLHFAVDAGKGGGEFGQLGYTVTFKKKRLVNFSAMTLELKGTGPLGKLVKIAGTVASEHDATYRLLAGKASEVRDHYRGLMLEADEPAGGRKFLVETRVYDDAVAFRYVVPEQAGLDGFHLAAERTQFNIAKDGTMWGLELPNFKSMYESEYIKLPVSAITNQGGVASSILLGCPCLIEVPGVGWMAITEADLRGNSSMYLTNPTGVWTGHTLESVLSPHPEGDGLVVEGKLPHHSAWRVMMVGDEPGRLVESNVLMSLNPETELKDTSWIHPGKASWNWWNGSWGADGKSGYTTEVMKYYVDFSARSGLEYMLIDAGWSKQRDITQMNGRVDVPGVVAYGKEKKVGVWIWLGYKDVARQMDEAFSLYEKWGVAGVKIDFIERNDQEGMAWYYAVAESAAKHHLMVDFHGSTTPSGMEREYPNVMGYEAVLGMEQSKAGMRDNPGHEVTLPFTRMLNGPMDFTPGSFHNVNRWDFEPVMERPMTMGTRAHQLAMYVVYYAPIQMVADDPKAYEGAKEFEFIKEVPTTWDETRVLEGVPGRDIVIARRKGKDWYVGAMVNEMGELDLIAVPLNFLGEGNFTATKYADGKEKATDVVISKQNVTRESMLPMDFAAGGGCAVRITPAK